jgi:hypothetical protein
MSTRDEVRRELKELAKLAETIRMRKERAVDAPPNGEEWAALATAGEPEAALPAGEPALSEAQALAVPPPRPSRATVPPAVSASRPSVSLLEAGSAHDTPLYRRRSAQLTLAAGAALVCAVAGTAMVGRRDVVSKPPVAATRGASAEVAVGKPAAAPPTVEPAAAVAVLHQAKPAVAESPPIKASPVVATPPAANAAASRPPAKPAIAKTRPVSSAEQSLDDMIRKALAAPSR